MGSRTDYFKLISKKIVKAKLSHIKAIVSLRSRNDAGKTSTMKQLCKDLFDTNPKSWKGPRQYNPNVVDYTRGEIKCVFEIEGLHIAVFSEGDTAKAMWEHFEYCMQHAEIDIVVLAVRSSKDEDEFNAEIAFSEVKKIVGFTEEIVWMEKYGGKDRVAEELRCKQSLMKIVYKLVRRYQSS